MKAQAVYGVSEKFGKIMRLTYEDGSKVYLSKKGITITLPKKKFRKEWNKRKKDFGFTFNMAELELLFKATMLCKKKWKSFLKKKPKGKVVEAKPNA